MPGIVPKFSESPGKIRSVGPDLGEHNADILMNVLNYSEEEIQSLKEKGVI